MENRIRADADARGLRGWQGWRGERGYVGGQGPGGAVGGVGGVGGRGPRGPRGLRGTGGDDANMGKVAQLIAAAVNARIPIAAPGFQPVDGAPGRNADMNRVAKFVTTAVDARLRRPAQGPPGTPGADGRRGANADLDAIKAMVQKVVGDLDLIPPLPKPPTGKPMKPVPDLPPPPYAEPIKPPPRPPMTVTETDALIKDTAHAEVARKLYRQIPSCTPQCIVCVHEKKSRILRALKTRSTMLALFKDKTYSEVTDYDPKALMDEQALESPITMQAMFISPGMDPRGLDRVPVPGFEFMVDIFISSFTGSFYTFQQVMDVYRKKHGRDYIFSYIDEATDVVPASILSLMTLP